MVVLANLALPLFNRVKTGVVDVLFDGSRLSASRESSKIKRILGRCTVGMFNASCGNLIAGCRDAMVYATLQEYLTESLFSHAYSR